MKLRGKKIKLTRKNGKEEEEFEEELTFFGLMNLRGYFEKHLVSVDFPLTFSTITFPVSISHSFSSSFLRSSFGLCLHHLQTKRKIIEYTVLTIFILFSMPLANKNYNLFG